MKKILEDKTHKKMCSMLNRKIKQGRQMGVCVCGGGIWSKTQVLKSGEERNGFLFLLLLAAQARCNKH